MHSVLSLKHAELTEKIIGIFFDVYNELGHGFLESVYHNALYFALREALLEVECQVPIEVWYHGHQIGDFKVDMVVDNQVLLELKAARHIDLAHEKQILNYLRATQIEVGLLLNFGAKPEFRRFVFENERKEIRVNPRQSAAKGVHQSAADGVPA